MSIQDRIAALNQQSQQQDQQKMTRTSSAGSTRSTISISPPRLPPVTSSVKINVASMRNRFDTVAADQLQKQLDSVTKERNLLKQRLDDLECLSAPFFFPSDDPFEGQPENDYDDLITSYNLQLCQKRMGPQNQIDQLTDQLSACEMGTQWVVTKFVRDLEQERLHTKTLKTIVNDQQTLIHTLEDTLKLKPEHQRSSFYEQQFYLLSAQLDLQRLELDDQQEQLTVVSQERDQLAARLHPEQSTPSPPSQLVPLMTPPLSSSHPRSSSSSSDSSVQSYHSWDSFDDVKASCFSRSSFTSGGDLLARPCTPPQSPPPKDPLPQPPFSLSHKSSMSDMHTIHHHHHYYHRPDEKQGYEKKHSLKRQPSFWKTFRQRLA
ncbi:hypothetical protein DM01DRAFT_1390697 [Hesseltinella vesiculosa]|uniref:Uncharacterized protein n=1 Tax=Hesseltinella vesiculosa TaxID=101127 RepID=A0A1X2GH18_9FUNG|nr:hypothetical protein DM01DRAFT_1390697 [Hesseltinella vesiculosa]